MTKENFKYYVKYIREWETLYDPFDPATKFGRKLMIDILADATGAESREIEMMIADGFDPGKFYDIVIK